MGKVGGNLESLKDSMIKEIESIYEIEILRGEFLPRELALKLADLTGRINREISVFINRRGAVMDISVGDSSTVVLPDLEGRRDKSRLSGLRCIHTHPNGDYVVSTVDLSSLIKLRLDAMVAIGALNGEVKGITAAVPARDSNGEFTLAEVYGPFQAGDNLINGLFQLVAEKEKSGGGSLHEVGEELERAILVGVEPTFPKIIGGKSDGERMLDELAELAETAGVEVVDKILQKKPVRDPATFIGRGKLEDLSLLRQSLNANLIIFDDELSGAQVRNIEELVGAKVVDRTTLILDIFAKRAHSSEGKIQVELAQLRYRLPRLMGLGNQLSRLGGGIGTRGPGEKKLEVDRRHIRRRISHLEEELGSIAKRRGLAREDRKRNSVPTVALVGYTNVGKSTLLNTLCGAEVLAENKLFATLDPTIRSFQLTDGKTALMVDTVGFIRKLPHDLIEAFKSTLEEAVEADILLHVVDASSIETEMQVQVVNSLLSDLGALNKPVVLVMNKVDKVRSRDEMPLVRHEGRIVEVSALTGQGLGELLEEMSRLISSEEIAITARIPYADGWVLPYIHENGRVTEEAYEEQSTLVKAFLDRNKVDRIKAYLIQD